MDPRTQLVDAVTAGDVGAVRALLESRGPDGAMRAEFSAPFLTSALWRAASGGNVEVVGALLEWRGPRGENLYAGDALSRAAEGGHLGVVRAVLAWRGPHGEYVCPYVYVICDAAENGHVEVVRELLAWKGPRNEYVDPRRSSAVWRAAKGGHVDVVRELLAWRGPNNEWVDPTAEPETSALWRAADGGHVEVVRELLAWRGPDDRRVDLTAALSRALNRAASKNQVEVVRALLAKTVDPSACDYAFRIAIQYGHIDVMHALLTWRGPRGQRVVPDYKAVNFAACGGDVEVLRVLLEWKGPAGERVDISVARRMARIRDAEICARVLAVCDEVEEGREQEKRWSDLRAAWVAASLFVRGIALSRGGKGAGAGVGAEAETETDGRHDGRRVRHKTGST
jgi:hypothetical protein